MFAVECIGAGFVFIQPKIILPDRPRIIPWS